MIIKAFCKTTQIISRISAFLSIDTNLAKRNKNKKPGKEKQKINELRIIFLKGQLDMSPRVATVKCVRQVASKKLGYERSPLGLGREP